MSVYDSASNPLATQKLQRTYLIAADNIVIEQLYASVILQQPSLDVSQLSPGLATTISTFQARMKNNARFVLNKVVPDFITTLTDASNFGNLVEASFSVGASQISNAYQDAESANSARTIASTIANKAGEIGVHVNTLNDNYAVGKQNISQYVGSYKTSMGDAIDLLGDSAKQASSEIDNLQAAITQNIKDIVEGGDEVGGAVTKLVTGILDIIKGAGNEPKPKNDTASGGDKDKDKKEDKEKEDKDDDDDEEEDDTDDDKEDDTGDDKPKTDDKEPGTAPNVDFAVQSIKASSQGMAKASEASQALTINNQKLADAYRKMAQENALIAIAKVMQVQNQMFLDGLAQLEANASALKTEWAAVESAYSDFSQRVGSVNEQSEANDMSIGAQAARTLWKALGGQLSYVKNSMAGVM